ncbi:MAG: hypothetical protein A3A80_04485 [Candidatus Terrybacteria bacterium RIFCSPLOWO2_01_FULL_44_24]|uniref:D-alanine--D-alanine ligase n=1 Tax=Candidatus Terrybacteria bacterium RIFCSPHIGHO2_01_FULL_43_35 TaxID=1802361 RepID=A0A1G2PE72_9BACT|nr:MAG: hypothetical protein A2828_01360 [Candidatus Terrybacteria bacterium RIFCSPHIGHO2_01_FULL_43_35]OHA49677.1 MAG: hypothetical protein A3B75_01140 [Candidatus Terrybacteria bacterium RIFCSPHIGHO2_02_FULL_43_14]OHA51342.1 MAG: hypothetical protein A3A80_04485 [Candidatus Terrybacteria bacterium RIFCSPLOWO2_01_FULL_44_24]
MAQSIAVIMGGPSSEHEISLHSGQMILRVLAERYRNIKPIIVSKEGYWHVDGKTVSIERALSDIKVALLATHGQWGEDGHLQAILENFSVPYTGSRVGASALAFDKSISRVIFRASGLNIPEGMVMIKNSLPPEERAKEIIRVMPNGSWLVKPAQAGSSVGVSFAKYVKQLVPAMAEAWKFGSVILVEEYIDGIEITCGVLEDLKTKQIFALPLTQIIPPPKHDFFDFSAKYSGETMEITPAPIDNKVAELAREAALRAHAAIGARHYSRVDMILKNNVPHILEINTLPGLTDQSLLPKQAQARGLGFAELLEHLIQLALVDAQ